MLGVCQSCRKFARGEVCPFCGGSVAAPLPGVTRRTTRAGRVIGATAVAVALGCGSAVYGGPPVDGGNDADNNDAAAKDAAPDTIMGAYGGPPMDAGGN